MKPPKTAKEKSADLVEDESDADQDQVNNLFAAVNDLPADDPLRNPQPAPQPAAVLPAITSSPASASPQGIASQVPAKKTSVADSEVASPPPTAINQKSAASNEPSQNAAKSLSTPTTVTISDGKRLTVPSLVGLPVRKVIEMASSAGLNVEIVGSGLAREQAPAPGSKVPNGTKIVVRFSR